MQWSAGSLVRARGRAWRRGVRRRVNYADPDVEELGSVYEGLLEYHPHVDHDRWTFDLVAGAERKQTGSYYTPHALVMELIDSALVPVMEARLDDARRVANGERRVRFVRSVQSYRDLEIWQRAMALAEQVYRLTGTFPREEIFGLTSQARRAATSIPANIAEGWGREGTKEFQQFLRIARGSLRELETHLLLSQRVGYCEPADLTPLLDVTTILGKQILTLQRRLSTDRRS